MLIAFVLLIAGFSPLGWSIAARAEDAPLGIFEKNEAGSDLKWRKNRIVYGIAGSGVQKIRTSSFLSARYLSLLTGIEFVPWESGHIDLYILASDKPAEEGPGDKALNLVARGSELELRDALRTDGFTSINVHSSNPDGEIMAAAIVVSTAVDASRYDANLLKEMVYSLGFRGVRDEPGSIFSRRPALPTRADEEIIEGLYRRDAKAKP